MVLEYERLGTTAAAMMAGFSVAAMGGHADANPSAKCKCPGLRITQNRYIKGGPKKYVRYSFKVGKGGDPNECVLVQLIRGSAYQIYENGTKMTTPRSIATIPASEPGRWTGQIDSPDDDPVVWSTKARRVNYAVAGKRRWACDSPSHADFTSNGQVAVVDDLQFEVRLYCASDVPKSGIEGPEDLPKPIDTVTWEQSNCWQRGFKPTHPGFGKACKLRKRKPPRRPYKATLDNQC